MMLVMQTLLTITLIAVTVFFVSETVRNLEREEVKLLRDIRSTLHSILGLLKPVPFYARITTMPKSIEVGQTATAMLQVVGTDGAPFVLDSTYTVTPSAATPASVSFGPVNADGSFIITGVAADAGDSIGATITGGPKNVSVVATPDVLTITAGAVVPASATVVLQ